MGLLYVKSLHIIFVVTWFAGLFYIVRLFIYKAEADENKNEAEAILKTQFALMQKRLWYGITWPSMIFTFVFGWWMVVLVPSYLYQSWFVLKLCFVLGLTVYHFLCQAIYNQQTKEMYKFSSQKLRIWNEVATLFLVSIVFIVVLKSTLDWIYGLLGLLAFTAVLMIAIKIYKKYRKE
jgi:putative membrane protein